MMHQLGVLDRNAYKQYRYWQFFQKLVLASASGFSVAAALLDGEELRRLSLLVALFLWVLVATTLWISRTIAKQMVRKLPTSMQSLLLFSSEVQDFSVNTGAEPAESQTGS